MLSRFKVCFLITLLDPSYLGAENILMIRSVVFRRIIFPLTYLVIGVTSLYYWGSLDHGLLLIRFVGMVVFILSLIGMHRVHSLYPKKHDAPSDFPRLLKEGPYGIVRHPLYALTMVNQVSIPATALSLEGFLAFLACLPLWYILIKLEEKELIEYWGEEYLSYMREVPAVVPIPRRKRR